MDFVSLDTALTDIANAVSVPQSVAESPDFIDAWKHSEAAAELHQQLTNSSERRPRWAAIHNATGRPVFDDAVADEGLKLLEHVARWYNRKIRARTEHIIGCTKAGLDPDKEPEAVRPNDGRYVMAKLFRGQQLGFDLAELMTFLNGPDLADQRPIQPVTRQRAQEEAILLKLKELGYDPLALSKPPKGGESPAKQAVKSAFKKTYSDNIVNKAWTRLRNTERIKDA